MVLGSGFVQQYLDCSSLRISKTATRTSTRQFTGWCEGWQISYLKSILGFDKICKIATCGQGSYRHCLNELAVFVHFKVIFPTLKSCLLEAKGVASFISHYSHEVGKLPVHFLLEAFQQAARLYKFFLTTIQFQFGLT